MRGNALEAGTVASLVAAKAFGEEQAEDRKQVLQTQDADLLRNEPSGLQKNRMAK